MKVLIFAQADERMGSAKSLLELVYELKQKNIACIVVNPFANKLNKDLTAMGIENYSGGFSHNCHTPHGNFLRRTLAMQKRKLSYYLHQKYAERNIDRLVDFSDIDIIHTNNTVIDIGTYFAKKYHKPHVWHIREFGEEDFGLKYYHDKMGKYISDNSDAVIMISDAISQSWVGKGVAADKAVTILHGVSKKKYLNEPSGDKEGKLKIIFAGGVYPSKGQLDFIKAIDSLSAAEKQYVQLDIYGQTDKDYERAIDEYIKHNKLQAIVRLHGYSDNLNEILPQYDVGIVNSLCEGMGRVTIEYMLSGLYVQASNRGANPEILLYGKLGGVHEFGDIQDMARAIRYCIANPDECRRIGRAAREYALEHYTIEKNVDKFIELYHSLLSRK